MEILEVLKLLDPKNDEQWTADGLPKVDVVAELVGSEVTRTQITDALPDFNRASETPLDEDPKLEVSAESPYEKLVAERDYLNEELNVVAKDLAQINEARENLERRIHYVSGLLDQLKPADAGQQNIINYLNRQKEVGKKRAENMKVLRESGALALLKGAGKAAIDAAMNKRKPARGSVRPAARPLVGGPTTI